MVSSSPRRHLTLLLAAALLPWAGPSAQRKDQKTEEPPPSLADLQAFEIWLTDYKAGAFRLVKDGETDFDAVKQLDATMAALAKWGDLISARKLFEAAWVMPAQAGNPSATERIDFHREVQPFRVQALVRAHLVKMEAPEVEAFLIERVNVAGRGFNEQSSEERVAAMRTLGERQSLRGLLTILQAAKKFPPVDRVRAINVLSQYATLETVPSFLGMLRDREPNARIAALNGIGKGLRPHTDETAHAKVSDDIAKVRDEALAAIKPLLNGDNVWQVRAAAREAAVGLRCKQAIPLLVDALDLELKRTKDPWSLDVRLHDALERMTGLDIPMGKAQPWRDFWAREGASFEYVRAQDARQAAQRRAAESNDRYRKFFKLDLDSDRVLFVVDLSGSMKEPAGRRETSAGGPVTTKHKLVMEEMKKIVMAIPDGGGFNLVVFNDRVQVWRPDERGRPMMVKIDDAARDDLLGSFLDALQPSGPTNLYGALDAALDFGGRGLHDKYYEAGFDTLYVLSDGAPSYGEITDRDEIRKRVREANGLRRIVINCITFGDQNETEFLRKLAEENGGRHVHVE